MIAPMHYTHLGYKFLDKVDKNTFHPGVDLNFGKPEEDLGKDIYAMTDGIVLVSQDSGKGWGNLIVIFHPKYQVWSRYAHLNERQVAVGEEVKEGQLIGRCGNTGGSWSPHLHWDVITRELPKWTAYTKYWLPEKVKEYYADPIQFVAIYRQDVPDIVKWHQKHELIREWSEPPTPQELKIGWALYKTAKAISTGTLRPEDFTLGA